MPPGVINFVPGLPHGSTNVVARSPGARGHPLHRLDRRVPDDVARVGDNIDNYKTYPRLVGETGGKDFILAHPSADPKALATAIVRGGFEYQGQKCSAASRVYVARSVWDKMKDELVDTIGTIKVGDVSDFSNFMGAVIEQRAFDKHAAAIAEARETTRHEGPRRRRHRRPRGLVRAADADHDRGSRRSATCTTSSSARS